MIPTKQVFLKNLKECNGDEYDELEMKREWYDEYYDLSEASSNWTDQTNESINDDERDFIVNIENDEFYKLLLKLKMKDIIRDIKERIPKRSLMKFATDKEIKELKRIEQMQIVEEL